MTNPITNHVAGVMSHGLYGPGFATLHGVIPRALPYVKPSPIIGLPQAPIASIGANNKAGASNPNESSSLSASGDVDPEKLDEDIDKIKNIEKEIKKKEEAQKLQEENLKKEQEKLDKEKEEAKKIQNSSEQKRKLEKIEEKQKKLTEEKTQLENEKKTTAEQRKQFDEKIARPFAQKDENGSILKDKKGNIQFLEKESLDKLKQSLKAKDPETIKNVKDALEEFNKYRKAYPSEEAIKNTDQNYSRQQQELATMAPSSKANAFNTLEFEEETIAA